MPTVIVLQARTTSSRLPGKVLLSVAGIPLVVLAAKRAMNTGRKLIVATSSEPEDDELSRILHCNALDCYRGSLWDTLGRVVGALSGYPDDTVVVRLTADNPLPDGNLIDEVITKFLSCSREYISTNGPRSGLPYGVSVEVTRLRELREAADNTSDSHDREHVTPYIIRKHGGCSYEKYRYLGMSHLRATIDLLEDYLSACYIFSSSSDPLSAPFLGLLDRLAECELQPMSALPAEKLVFGAAQLGMKYGITNAIGRPQSDVAERMLKKGISNGIKFIDTARAYGESEQIIGNCLANGWDGRAQIITKLSPLDGCGPASDPELVLEKVNASIYESCMALRRQHLDVLMLHRAQQLNAWDGQVLQQLMEMKRRGIVKRLGVSVQNPDELEESLAVKDVDLIQMPFNIIDGRWRDSIKKIIMEKDNREITIHARSTLLQGLLASRDLSLWRSASLAEPEELFFWFDGWISTTESLDMIDLCFRYVRSQDWIDGIVVGMESMEQLQQNIRYFEAPILSKGVLEEIVATRPIVSPSVLDPSCWERVLE